MNKLLTPPTTTSTSTRDYPDFGGHPHGINLNQAVTVRGHGKLVIRPIRLDDEQEMARFHANLSEESVYLRYFEYLGLDRRTTHERLVRICANTAESYAVVIERPASSHGLAAILAVGRLSKTSEPLAATFDTLIEDEENEPRLGSVLVKHLVKLARAFGFETLTGDLLVADHDGLNLCRSLGFTLHMLGTEGLVRVTLNL
jgi:acetyltransferase